MRETIRPAAQHCWPVWIRLVAENNIQVVGVQAENETDVIIIMTVVTVVMMAVPVALMGIMVTSVMTMALVVIERIPVTMFVTFPVAVSIAVILAAIVPVVGLAMILLIMAMPATVAIIGARDQR
jgi:hypothetical protein